MLLGVWGLGVALGSVVFARSVDRSLGVLLSAVDVRRRLRLPRLVARADARARVRRPASSAAIGNGVQWAALISTVQRLTPQHLHGRLMGAVESLGAIFPAIGYVLGSAITVAQPRRASRCSSPGVGVTSARSRSCGSRSAPTGGSATPQLPAASAPETRCRRRDRRTQPPDGTARRSARLPARAPSRQPPRRGRARAQPVHGQPV